MPVGVSVAAAVAANTPFTFRVPGHQNWRLHSIRAVLSRGVGGTPNRFVQLTISDGTNTFITIPGQDAGTEPGTLTISWANTSDTTSSSGSVGVSVAPMGQLFVPAGYTITGTVINGVAADAWTQAVAWYDYTYNGPET